MSEGEAGRDTVGSLQRGLTVLEILAAHPGGLTLTEMADKAGLTRAGARRFLLTLVSCGYALQQGRKGCVSLCFAAGCITPLAGVRAYPYRNIQGA